MAGPPTYNLGISGGSLFHETIVALGTVKGDFLGFFFFFFASSNYWECTFKSHSLKPKPRKQLLWAEFCDSGFRYNPHKHGALDVPIMGWQDFHWVQFSFRTREWGTPLCQHPSLEMNRKQTPALNIFNLWPSTHPQTLYQERLICF